MWKVLATLLCVAGFASALAAEPSVVLGSARSLGYLAIQPPCPEDSICLNGWYRYNVTVDRTLHGPELRSLIRAVHSQHTEFNHKYRRALRLFVLRHIDDAKVRAELQADYYLIGLSPARQLYCLGGAPGDIGLSDTSVAVAGQDSFCFSADQVER